jgi:hypothetical protein
MGRINNDATFFMSYVRGEDRGQAALLPAAIEDYVAADAPAAYSPTISSGQSIWSVPPPSGQASPES